MGLNNILFTMSKFRHFLTTLVPIGGHDQSQPGGHQTLDHTASHRDPGVRGRCRHRVHFQPAGREGNAPS